MDILIGTTNLNKVDRIKRLFKDSNYNFLSLNSFDYQIQEPEENGKDGVENARIKAKHYYHHLKIKIPVLTQDDTLFLSGISKEDNPQKDVKLPVIKKYGQFTDDNAFKYYSDLIKKYDREYLDLEFRYGHAICFQDILLGSSSVLSGRLYSKICPQKTPNYFFASMTKVLISNIWKYYAELTENELIAQDSDFYRSVSSLLEKIKVKF